MSKLPFSSTAARPVVVTRSRAAIVVIVAYTAAALTACAFFFSVETLTGHADARNGQLSLIFAAVLALLCLRSLLGIYRRPKVLEHERA